MKICQKFGTFTAISCSTAEWPNIKLPNTSKHDISHHYDQLKRRLLNQMSILYGLHINTCSERMQLYMSINNAIADATSAIKNQSSQYAPDRGNKLLLSIQGASTKNPWQHSRCTKLGNSCSVHIKNERISREYYCSVPCNDINVYCLLQLDDKK